MYVASIRLPFYTIYLSLPPFLLLVKISQYEHILRAYVSSALHYTERCRTDKVGQMQGRRMGRRKIHNGNSNNNNNNNNDGINNSGNAIGKAALKILASLSNRKWETVANDGIYSIRQTYELMKSSYVAIEIVAELVIVLPMLNNRRKHHRPIWLNRTSANGVDQQT